jgi:hypothetical protein
MALRGRLPMARPRTTTDPDPLFLGAFLWLKLVQLHRNAPLLTIKSPIGSSILFIDPQQVRYLPHHASNFRDIRSDNRLPQFFQT